MKEFNSLNVKIRLLLAAFLLLIFFWPFADARAARVAGLDETPVVQPSQSKPAADKISAPPAASVKPDLPAKAEKKEEAATSSPEKEEKPADPSIPKKTGQKYVTLDFDNVDISVLVKFVSELTGKNFLIDEKVKGKVTVMSPKKIPVNDVYKVFLSILEINGFTVVPSGDMIKIVPSSVAREKSLEIRTKKDLAEPEDRMVTQVISLERANPDEIKRVLDPIVPKTGSVLSYPAAGMLIVTDYLSNIRRIQEIVSALDIEGAGGQISYIPLQNASASEVVKSLSAIFQPTMTRATGVRMVADARTNSIILLASVAETENIRKLVAYMDRDVPRGESNIQVYRLQNSVAEDLAKVLTSIIQGASVTATPAAAGTTQAAQKITTPAVSKNVQVVPDKATNTLVIMAEREDYKILESIIKQLDVPRAMVYIEALIMEVNATKDFKLGVEWRGITEHGSVDGNPTAAFIGSGGAGTTANPGGYNILDGLITTTPLGVTGAFPSGFSMGIIGTGITIGGVTFPSIGAVVQAYKNDSEVSILSTPQILTLDNEEAEINVGSNVPYLTRQDTTSSTTSINYNNYEYRDVGVTLNITPHINEENFIRLKISQQVTKVVAGVSSDTTKPSTPTTLKRTAKTTVVVKDKETVVIGGLVGDSTEASTYRIPLVGDIPLLGWLFKTKASSREKTNLYVFITPHIVRTQQEAAALYQEKRESMGEVKEGIIRLNEKKSEPTSKNESVPPSAQPAAKP
jgi:general secretion pathway protein D